jgi:uridine phosphorylase
MALITMDEALSAGAKSFIFIGTCSSIKGRIRYGVLYQGSNIVSLLNPFEEHDLWQRIKMADVVDMEAKYLLKHAAKRSIRLQTILIVTDAIWKDRWERASFRSDGWKKTIKDSFNKLAKLLSEVV